MVNNYSKAGAPLRAGQRLRAGLIGYTGYSGAELAGLLERHPTVELTLLDHRKADAGAKETAPAACGPQEAKPVQHIAWVSGAIQANKLDVVFTATPPEVSQELIPEVLSQGARAVDLSGAFRLPTAAEYRRWYGAEHAHPELLKEAVYGLPELYREKIRTACLVANPGCYPTATICALWPLLKNDLVDREAGVICDAKSGVSGAGKNPSPKTHFVQVSENFSAYAILKHRHVPEMTINAGIEESNFSFTAHLLPTQRGILATHYLRLKQPTTLEAVYDVYRAAYAQARFIRLYPAGSTPQLATVNGTNFCDIHCTLTTDGRRLVVVSCIDNLVKGAAGQAVQNMNVMFGLDEAAGLIR
jgi:N-acetyl-gamma-glutamyl-phosphate reductase